MKPALALVGVVPNYTAMYLDVVDLRSFYSSPIGHMAQRMIRLALRRMWPDVRGDRILGVGYAIPFLQPFLTEAERVCAFMPAQQGIVHWPEDGANLTCLTEDEFFPLPDSFFDRIILIHAIENSEKSRALLQEVSRVLVPGGKIIIVAPSRASLWSRTETTPFGHGRPYSRTQMIRLLRHASFAPVSWDRALFFPPIDWRWILRAAVALEHAGRRWWSGLCGVHLVEATKQIYATPRVKQVSFRQKRARVPVLTPEVTGQSSRNRQER